MYRSTVLVTPTETGSRAGASSRAKYAQHLGHDWSIQRPLRQHGCQATQPMYHEKSRVAPSAAVKPRVMRRHYHEMSNDTVMSVDTC